MKKSTFTLAILAVLFVTTTAFANTPNYEVWDYGTDPLTEVMEMEAIPVIDNPVFITTLKIDVMATKDNFFRIDLPFAEDEIIGLVIYDKKGNLVFNEKHEYGALKTVLINDTGDNEYIVKAYRGNSIFQARLKVVHL